MLYSYLTSKRIAIWLARIAFGLLLPAYLLWFLFVSHYNLQRVDTTNAAFERLSLGLDRLEKYHDDQVFFHALLRKNFIRADKAINPAAKLVNTLTGLREMFSGNIKFIVWNKNGTLNKEESDEKHFQFILKTMFTVLHDLKKAYDSGLYSEPSGLTHIVEKLNLLRGYFGPFLFVNQLFEPLKPDYLGKSLFVAIEPEKRLLWFYPGDNFSIACFIDAAMTRINFGPKTLIDKANSMPRPQKLAFIKTGLYESYGLPVNRAEQTEIKLEARKFESYAVSSCESTHFLLNFRQVSPDLIVVSYQNKSNLPDPTLMATSRLFQWGKWLLVILFIVYCHSLRLHNWCLSVRQKMMLLFIFSNGLPLLVLMSTGYEFFYEKKNDLINSTHQESLRILKEVDVRFPEVSSALATRINSFVDKYNANNGSRRWPDSEIGALKEVVGGLGPQEAILYEKDGSRAFYLANSSNRTEKIMTDMLQRSLDFFSISEDFEQQKIRNTMLEQLSSNDLILHFFLSFADKFSLQGSGNLQRWTYVKFVGAPEKFKLWGILAVSWEKAAFIKEFIGDHLISFADEVAPRILGAMEKSSEQMFCRENIATEQIKSLLRQTVSRKLVTRENIELAGQKYLFTSISGNEISDGILVALFPQSIIDARIRQLKLSIIFGMLLVVITLTQIVRIFSRRLLAPVEGLAKGISSIRQRDFSAHVDYRSEDELGQLVKVFNQTVDGMQDLAIGTAVQVSLLAPERHQRGRVDLFARSLFMTKMGGDYFDYFDLPQNRLVIFFGDVAGHGIPAAMIMAMAKAVVTAAVRDFVGPAALLGKAGKVLRHLKKRNWRRMMTAQCVDFNCDTGEFMISSAGHCYPVIVKNHGTATDMLIINSFPLGSASQKPYEEVRGKLLPGETLILYTDGVVEATDAVGEMFGYSRFDHLLQTAWAEDLELYWQQIFTGYKAWAVTQDDDLTFLMLRFKEKHHER